MGDYAKKPKNYKRGRCLEFERICQEEREAGETVVVVRPCERTGLPCLVDVMVLSGCEQPCAHCAPNVQRMRDLHGWERSPATHGTFYTSKHITPDQQHLVAHRIGQCDIRNWINESDE